MRSLVLLIYPILFLSLAAQAQQQSPALDSIVVRFGEKSGVRLLPSVFLHMDKTIYVQNENIWFTAYLINGNAQQDHTLYVCLTDPMKKKVLIREQYVLEKFISQGSLMLPDSLESGEYRLLAYTNSYLEEQRQEVYQQVISVRPQEKNRVNITDLSVAGSNSDTLKLKYKVTNFEQKPSAKDDFIYALYSGNRLLDSGRRKTDIWGEVPLTLPLKNAKSELVMDITARYGTETKKTRIPVTTSSPLTVKLFPEGGNLVHGKRARVAFEIAENGSAVSTQGVLLADGEEITRFSSNTSGRGWFYFLPQQGIKYSVMLRDRKLPITPNFPPVLADGFSLYIEKGLVEDTLPVTLSAPESDSLCYLVLHNYHDIFFSGKIALPNGAARLKLPLNEVPRGLATVTIFNTEGIPVAERAVMCHNSRRLFVNITTDSSQYHTRSKVQVKIKVTDATGAPVSGFISVGLALDKRVDTTRFRDIDRYYYFEQHLPVPTVLPAYRFFDNEQQMEELLLTKCWTRYRPETPPLPPSIQYSTDLQGQVLLRNKPLTRPSSFMIIAEKSSNLMVTDSAGRFTIPHEYLRGPADSKVAITALGGQKRTILQDYSIDLSDSPLDTLNARLAEVYIPFQALREDILSSEEKLKMKSMLKEVVVKSRNSDNYLDEFRSKDCNDWVCMYNVLNCRNHPYGTKPESGMRYRYNGTGAGASGFVTYKSCARDSAENNGFMKRFHATWYAKEFYVTDYANSSPPEQELFTTVYWNHGVMINENGELNLSFYTNDLAGRFVLITEGFSTKGLMSGRTWFRVANE
ncbi:hypothetical protein [uncultured Chitinophaga sp.]|uniref:hypothetical protein n=1 Tax=uncultured Chitinophaga sp. TaxID=339340 RepID=UPI0025D26E95|nr:hypothetical protein [uncultured Chitinophaga sp.]